MADHRPLLPLLGHGGGRDAMTCLYRCGNACDHPVPNESDNPYLGDVVNAGISRRGVVRAGTVGALVLGLGGATAPPASPAPAAPAEQVAPAMPAGGRAGPLTFKAIPPNRLD